MDFETRFIYFKLIAMFLCWAQVNGEAFPCRIGATTRDSLAEAGLPRSRGSSIIFYLGRDPWTPRPVAENSGNLLLFIRSTSSPRQSETGFLAASVDFGLGAFFH
jgi:hypothetical protein